MELFTSDFNLLLELKKNQHYLDIKALCQTNVAFRRQCQRSDFWKRLILISYDLTVEDATEDDYIFLHFLNNIKRPKSKKINYFIDQMISQEMAAWQSGAPIKVFFFDPEMTSHPNRFPNNRIVAPLKDKFFEAYTLSGMILQANALLDTSQFLSIAVNQVEEHGDNPRDFTYFIEQFPYRIISFDEVIIESYPTQKQTLETDVPPEYNALLEDLESVEFNASSSLPRKYFYINDTHSLSEEDSNIFYLTRTLEGALFLANLNDQVISSDLVVFIQDFDEENELIDAYLDRFMGEDSERETIKIYDFEIMEIVSYHSF